MIKLKSLLKEYKYGGIINMKDQMESGKFDPKNPDVHIAGWGVLDLKGLHRWISRDLKELASDASIVSDHAIKNIEKRLYGRHAPLQHKILALNEVYKYMNKPQYKRAVTMYKRRR